MLSELGRLPDANEVVVWMAEKTQSGKSEPVTDPVLERRIEALEAELRQRDRAVIEEAQA